MCTLGQNGVGGGHGMCGVGGHRCGSGLGQGACGVGGHAMCTLGQNGVGGGGQCTGIGLAHNAGSGLGGQTANGGLGGQWIGSTDICVTGVVSASGTAPPCPTGVLTGV